MMYTHTICTMYVLHTTMYVLHTHNHVYHVIYAEYTQWYTLLCTLIMCTTYVLYTHTPCRAVISFK